MKGAVERLTVSVVPGPLLPDPTEKTYAVDWGGIPLSGTYTQDVDLELGTYLMFAQGTYGGSSGTYDVLWTSVRLEVQPNFAQLFFEWEQGYTGYAVSPSYVGKPGPWTSADEAWQDLTTKGAEDGVNITVVPEPAVEGDSPVARLVVTGSESEIQHRQGCQCYGSLVLLNCDTQVCHTSSGMRHNDANEALSTGPYTWLPMS